MTDRLKAVFDAHLEQPDLMLLIDTGRFGAAGWVLDTKSLAAGLTEDDVRPQLLRLLQAVTQVTGLSGYRVVPPFELQGVRLLTGLHDSSPLYVVSPTPPPRPVEPVVAPSSPLASRFEAPRFQEEPGPRGAPCHSRGGVQPGFLATVSFGGASLRAPTREECEQQEREWRKPSAESNRDELQPKSISALDFIDAPPSDLPPELDFAALPRWMRAVPEQGPPEEEQREAGSGPDACE